MSLRKTMKPDWYYQLSHIHNLKKPGKNNLSPILFRQVLSREMTKSKILSKVISVIYSGIFGRVGKILFLKIVIKSKVVLSFDRWLLNPIVVIKKLKKNLLKTKKNMRFDKSMSL